ncbi:conserved hypothetical protein [Coccidioides posadasii str. Silveira]|uniref:Uncharacterized protein n=1 Tax=Coccidioides posadasii (strain RMSCC 757 / Silveira) TaxID=443226 RepID=E9DB78_COCPS|nr:conserved hypothetical protein [Coccidioides posadasii str. Silveira]
MAGQSNLPPLAPATKNQGLVITRDSGVNLNGHFFNNLTAAMEYINNQAPHHQYADFHDAQKITLDVKQHHIDIQKIKNRLVATWGIDKINAIWPKVESLWATQKLHHTLNVYKDWDKFTNNINSAVLQRLDATGAGHHQSLAILPDNYTTADKELLALPQSSSSQHSIQNITKSPPTASSPQDLLEEPQSPRSSRDIPMGGMLMLHSHNLPFGFTSMLANPSSQSEAPKHHSEKITAMSAHQILQGLDNKDESVIPPESDEEIPQHE